MEEKKKKILEICPNFPLSVLTDSEIENIKLENDLLKGFLHNKKVYLEFKESINPSNDVVFFNICHMLGMFNKNGAELKYIGTLIMCLYSRYSEEDIYMLGTGIENIRYIEKTADTLINGISVGNLQGHVDMFIEYCNNYKRYSKDMFKINNNRKNTINIRGAIYPDDQDKLRKLRSIGKAVIMEDVIDYVSKKRLLDSIPSFENIARMLLLRTYDYDEVVQIIEFYDYSLNFAHEDEKYFENIGFDIPENKRVEWLSSTKPINLTLGYILKVCSTFTGTGSKIMIDGILDPRNKHVVFERPDGYILAKATCICHDNHIFCNALNFIPSVLDNLTREEERDYYYYYLCAIKAQYDSLKQRGFDIREIRIATDEYQIINCIRGRETSVNFKKVLSKCSYYWGEIDEKLFDHNPPEYILKNKKVSQ